jgi:hypothetical protein
MTEVVEEEYIVEKIVDKRLRNGKVGFTFVIKLLNSVMSLLKSRF